MKPRLRHLIAAVLLMVFMLAGCSAPPSNTPVPPKPSAPTAQKGTSAPAAPTSVPLEADWTLHVNQTITVEVEGLPVNHTLILVAKKAGGTDIYGSYEGLAYVRTWMDASVLSNEVITASGGFDLEYNSDAVQFDILPYDADTFSAKMPSSDTDVITIAPLVVFNGMAHLTPDMQGSGVVNPLVQGVQGERGEFNASVTGTAPMPMRIGVSNAEVYVEIPALKTGQMFEGQLIGDPVPGKDPLDEARKLIEAQRKEADENNKKNDPGNDDGGLLAGLGDIIGQVGSQLALPASFAKDDFPIAGDANIINVFEKDDPRILRIMYSTQLSLDELKALYQDVIDRMGTQALPVDGGEMFMGSMDGYQSVILMIMNDPNGNGMMVSLEYTLP